VSTSDSVRHELRAATQAIHERLHIHPLMGPLTGPALTMDGYRRALRALYGFHLAVERRVGDDGRLALLRADLMALGDGPDAIDALPLAPVDPGTGTPARLAARYVLDGSAHGGRAMLPNLRQTLGIGPERGAAFFASAGLDTAGAWQALLLALETELAAPGDRRAARDAAVGLFAGLERWLDRCAGIDGAGPGATGVLSSVAASSGQVS
jgi:heme oxygenase